MQVFFKRLLDGDTDAAETIKKGGDFFKGYFDDKLGWTADQFANDLGAKQMSFEWAVSDDRFDAKMLMPFAALGELYRDDEGFSDRTPLAREVAKGFFRSSVSMEVKTATETAVNDFDLDIDDDAELRKFLGSD